MSLSISAPNEPPQLPIPLPVSCLKDSSIVYVWDPVTAFQIRTHLRLLGDFCGTLPKHIAQNQYLSIPLILSYDEVRFGVSRNYFHLIREEHASDVLTRGASLDIGAEEFWQTRKEDMDRQAEEAVQRHVQEREKRGLKRPRSEMNVEVDDTIVGKGNNGSGDVGGDLPPRKTARVGLFQQIGRSIRRILNIFQRNDSNLIERPITATNNIERNETVEEDKEAMLAERVRKQAFSTALVVTSTERRANEISNGDEQQTVKLQPPRGVCEQRLKQRQYVFADLYNKGYYMSCGAKFGADFLAYAGDPQLFHAALAVIVVDAKEELQARDVVALGRLGDSTKKRTVLAFVGKYGVEYVGVQWEETLP